MSKSIQRVKAKRPDLIENESVIGIAEDLDKYEYLSILADTEGGQLLIKNLRDDVVSAIVSCSKYKSASHAELMATCATITERLNMLRSLTRAKMNKQGALDALDKALEE